MGLEESKTGDDLNEAEYSAAGEILTKLALANPSLLDNYITIVKSTTSLPVKVAIGASVKHFFENDSFVDAHSHRLGLLLELSSVEGFLFESNLTLKQIGVNNLLFVTHKKPLVALPLVSKAIPTILEGELTQKKEYVKVLKIGPFKHKIDDALNFRRSLYELVYTLITSLEDNPTLLTLGHIDWSAVFTQFVTRSFRDDQTITFTSLLTLLKIVTLKPTIFTDSGVLEKFIASSNKLLNKKLKEDAPKQDVAKREDTNNAVLRCLKKMDLLVQKGVLKMDREGETQWRDFIKELRQKHSKFDNEE
ncbi:unnamed protein product [Ambrosiozyma monospora]|uniref:Unnamed protein product n=1 Tax=Ambrosiozyma monospora TaxID=43982 RepID=A0ACB5TNC1_AMBMO|nr:unnamed protein product [Ambrosiozyma monospora]